MQKSQTKENLPKGRKALFGIGGKFFAFYHSDLFLSVVCVSAVLAEEVLVEQSLRHIRRI